jgi:putative two-component system hydrogenase maturation factor HypX/HoxX
MCLDLTNRSPLNTLKQRDCAIDWSLDTVDTMARKVQSRDSQPGLLDSIHDTPVYLYGAHIQSLSTPCTLPPKTLLSHDKGALLLSTQDRNNALWITHLRNPSNKPNPFKLPATMALPISFPISPEYPKYQDIWIHTENLGDERCFSNGIDLNTIEASKDSVQQSHLYINAINNLIRYIMIDMSDKIIIAGLRGHAGAGGAMLSQAADFVFINDNSVINPHYKTMGLYGSEYWTFNLSSRLGSFSQAQSLTDALLPLNNKQAIACGFADYSFSTIADIEEKISNDILPNLDEILEEKTRKRSENISKYGHPEVCRERELKIMYDNFRSLDYQRARSQFVRKLSPPTTPLHLLKLGRKEATLMSGTKCAESVLDKIKQQYSQGMF